MQPVRESSEEYKLTRNIIAEFIKYRAFYDNAHHIDDVPCP
jgi:hypothetical protein